MTKKDDNSLVKNKPRIIKIGDELVQVDGRNRPIKKVDLNGAKEFVGPKDLQKATKDCLKKEDLDSYVTKKDLLNHKQDLSEYLKKDEANGRFALQKGLHIYCRHSEVDEKIRTQNFSNLVRKEDIKDLVNKKDLGALVSREELARIISPGLLAKLVTKAELLEYCLRSELNDLPKKAEVMLKADSNHKISGDLEVSGKLTSNRVGVRLSSEKEQCSVRVVSQAPAKLTSEDKCVIIVNETSELFGVIVHGGKLGDEVIIKDGTGSAHHSSIKIVSAEQETFDGKSQLLISDAYGVKRLIHNGKEWNIL